MTRTVVIVQARLGSSRLPGKTLRDLAGRPLIDHVMERAEAICVADLVVLATSDRVRDDPLADYAVCRRWPVYRGPEQDVLLRMTGAARTYGADVVVRVTGDCPLLAPEVASAVIDLFRRRRETYGNRDLPFVMYASNDTTRSGYPDGTDVEVLSRDALELACHAAQEPAEREHVTTWVRRHCPTVMLPSPVDYSAHKLSVDSEQDYDYVRKVVAALRGGASIAESLSLATTMAAVARVPG